jgi:hypothetical protein
LKKSILTSAFVVVSATEVHQDALLDVQLSQFSCTAAVASLGEKFIVWYSIHSIFVKKESSIILGS